MSLIIPFTKDTFVTKGKKLEKVSFSLCSKLDYRERPEDKRLKGFYFPVNDSEVQTVF